MASRAISYPSRRGVRQTELGRELHEALEFKSRGFRRVGCRRRCRRQVAFGTEAIGQVAAARSMPMFEADAGWPKVPAKWKVGDQSSFAVDAQDNVWLLSRPRTLRPEQAAMAAPPVMVFDTAGNFIKAWGGAGSGFEWPEREHGIHIDYKGFVWIGGNSCPSNGLPGLKPVTDDQLLKFTQDGKFVMQIGHSNQSNAMPTRRICIGQRTSGYISRPTNYTSPTVTATIASPSSTRTPARSRGRGALSVTSRWMTIIARW